MKRKTGGQTVENQRFPTVQTPRFSVGAGCEGSSHSGFADEDIIKALECCISCECEDCPHDEETACKENLNQEVIDLITCQKAEIEALIAGQETLQKYIAEKNAEIERLTTAYPKTIESIKKMRDKAKAEAIKEFADRLTAELIAGGIYPAFVKGKIEKVKKEMVKKEMVDDV